jgi:hypothetical protein
MWAVNRGVALDEISVEVQADHDARGMYGLGGAPPG